VVFDETLYFIRFVNYDS